MLLRKSTWVVAFALLNLPSLAVAADTCFLPDGSADKNDLPCFRDSQTSRCCAQDQFCSTNKLCVQKDGSRLARGSCLDRGYGSTCPTFCKGIKDDDKVNVFQCGDPAAGKFCCDEGNGNACCQQSSKVFTLGPIQTFNETSIESTIMPMIPMPARPTSTTKSSSAAPSKATKVSQSVAVSTSIAVSTSVAVSTSIAVSTSVFVQTPPPLAIPTSKSFIPNTSSAFSVEVSSSSAISYVPPTSNPAAISSTEPTVTSTKTMTVIMTMSNIIQTTPSMISISSPTPVASTASSPSNSQSSQASSSETSESSTTTRAVTRSFSPDETRTRSTRTRISSTSAAAPTAASEVSSPSASASVVQTTSEADSSNSNSNAAVIGGAVGGTVGAAILIGVGYFCFRKRQTKQRFSNRFEKSLTGDRTSSGGGSSGFFAFLGGKSNRPRGRPQISTPIPKRASSSASSYNSTRPLDRAMPTFAPLSRTNSNSSYRAELQQPAAAMLPSALGNQPQQSYQVPVQASYQPMSPYQNEHPYQVQSPYQMQPASAQPPQRPQRPSVVAAQGYQVQRMPSNASSYQSETFGKLLYDVQSQPF